MKSHYIKGTNEQYSIREDGVVISHISKNNNKILYKDKYGISCIYYTKMIKTGVSIHILLFDYFGYRYCNNCNCKIYKKTSRTCNICQKNKARIADKNHYNANKELHKIVNHKIITNLNKGYCASKLNIPVKDLSDDIYIIYKKTLLFKREIAKKHNISINKLK